MNRGLLVGALACAVSSPAVAGDKAAQGLVPDARTVLMADVQLSYALRARLRAGPLPATLRPVMLPQTVVFALDPRSAPLRPVSLDFVHQAPVRGFRSIDAPSPSPSPSPWRVAIVAQDTTSVRGGSYAVGDILASLRQKRGPRSPLKTMFVLRIDGKDDSPPFSIGGGGVAAALWRAGQAY